VSSTRKHTAGNGTVNGAGLVDVVRDIVTEAMTAPATSRSPMICARCEQPAAPYRFVEELGGGQCTCTGGPFNPTPASRELTCIVGWGSWSEVPITPEEDEAFDARLDAEAPAAPRDHNGRELHLRDRVIVPEPLYETAAEIRAHPREVIPHLGRIERLQRTRGHDLAVVQLDTGSRVNVETDELEEPCQGCGGKGGGYNGRWGDPQAEVTCDRCEGACVEPGSAAA
jgi:hypothetical protein